MCAKLVENFSQNSHAQPLLRHRDRSICKTLKRIPIPAEPILHRTGTQRRLDSLFFGKYPRVRSFFSSFTTHEPDESALEDTLSNISSSFVAYLQQNTDWRPLDTRFRGKTSFFRPRSRYFSKSTRNRAKAKRAYDAKKPASYVAGFSMQRYFR